MRPRRLTIQRAPRHGRVALQLVIRRSKVTFFWSPPSCHTGSVCQYQFTKRHGVSKAINCAVRSGCSLPPRCQLQTLLDSFRSRCSKNRLCTRFSKKPLAFQAKTLTIVERKSWKTSRTATRLSLGGGSKSKPTCWNTCVYFSTSAFFLALVLVLPERA
jgi:hypothetical protein